MPGPVANIERDTYTMILKYIAKRFFNGVVAVLLIVSIAFFVIRLIPGDPVDIWLGDYATPQLIEHVTQLWGLDRPIHQQYGIFLWQLFHGNLGTSLRAKAPVTGLIRDVFPYTLRLMLAGILISVVFGIMLGTFAAVRHNSARDIVTMIASMAFVSIPGFLMGYILLFLLGVKARAFPLIGGEDGWNLFSMWKHLTLPALSLGLAFAGTIARMTRSTMIEMLNTDFVRTARSKGTQGIGRCLPACLAQYADVYRQSDRSANHRHAGWARGHGNGLLASGTGAAVLHRSERARLPADSGLHPCHRALRRRRDPCRRCELRVDRSANPVRLTNGE